jgi:hypothetical protein
MISRRTIICAAALTPAAMLTEAQAMDKIELLTRTPFSVRVLKDGVDISAAAGIASVKYNRDGSGTRTLADGRILNGGWRFLDAAQTRVETTAPTGVQTWDILELTESSYVKRETTSGIVIDHRPTR